MVCEKNKDTIHDFEKDPIKLKVEGDIIRAEGTTLGADNGIAVAYCLAILDSNDIPHPSLEVVITTEEETGMGGASKLNPENLDGKILINIDAEEEGNFFVSCAGGVRTKVILPVEWENADESLETYIVKVRGLKGGHSGMEIDKGRGNANKIMGRILKDLNTTFDIKLSDLSGGAKMNAIPREADAVIMVDSKDKETIVQKIEKWNNILKNELKSSDPDVNILFEKFDNNDKKVLSKQSQDKAISLLQIILNGIQTMSMDIEGLVESSTNLGVVTTKENEIMFESAVRSSVKSLKKAIVEHTQTVAEVVGAKLVTESDYPEWEYNPDSNIRKIMQKVYKEKFNKEPKLTAIHAGLECGLFKEKLGDIDMIALGPNMYDVHTPNEHLSISSTARTWELLLDVLKEIQ